jgi:hypothetical protein
VAARKCKKRDVFCPIKGLTRMGEFGSPVPRASNSG